MSAADPSNELPAKAAASMTETFASNGKLFCGVDLGTASIILVAVDEDGQPAACEMEPCRVAQDGLVVDYMGAIAIVKRLKARLEERLGKTLTDAAIAVPPGTSRANAGTHRHVTEAAGLEVRAVVDEPVAANAVLGVKNGVVVDIGGGTTGLSVFEGGEVTYSSDEATGGIHVSLVLMGRNKMSYEEAESYKQAPENAKEVAAAVLPVIEKMATIVKRHIEGRGAQEVHLVGGTTCLPGIEKVFERVLGLPVYKPESPMLVTPLGIALCCRESLRAEL